MVSGLIFRLLPTKGVRLKVYEIQEILVKPSPVSLEINPGQVMDKDQSNWKNKYRLGREWIQSSSKDKDLVMSIDKKLNMTQVVDAPSLEMFKARLDGLLSNLVQ
ncbi:hypothetical protein BTVI_75594 [Pitangus sulphuratus]|nr:hypothetical protein BTVI_75594 [Pitangus sulphuratus]